jgi:hypothetical protein
MGIKLIEKGCKMTKKEIEKLAKEQVKRNCEQANIKFDLKDKKQAAEFELSKEFLLKHGG